MDPHVPPEANINPYAAPSELEAEDESTLDLRQFLRAQGGLWRDGRLLVIRRGTVLPPICVKTGVPATRRISVALREESLLPILGFMLGCVPGWYLFTFLQERRILRLSICDSAYRELRYLAIQGLIALFFGSVSLAVGWNLWQPWKDEPSFQLYPIFFLLGLLLFVGGVAKLVSSGQPLTTHRFTVHYTSVNGAGEAFLQQLPEMPNLENLSAVTPPSPPAP